MEHMIQASNLLYSELLEHCMRGVAPSGRGVSFVSKSIRGQKHHYLQLTVGNKKTQHYLGPDTAELQQKIQAEKQLYHDAQPEIAVRQQLVSMLRAARAHGASVIEARVFEVLERAGVFLAGGVLVGSHAFALYGNMLGVHWKSALTQTHDIDIADDYHIQIGIDQKPIRLRDALLESGLGFFEVPALDRGLPSTRFAIRSRQIAVDILTPMRGKTSHKPIVLTALGVSAEPVRYLDYLLEDVQPAVVIAQSGVLVNVPTPARFALHKLVVAQRRPATQQTKALKDIDQAIQLVEVLLEFRPGDLTLAWEAALLQPQKFQTEIGRGLKRLPSEIRARLGVLLGID